MTLSPSERPSTGPGTTLGIHVRTEERAVVLEVTNQGSEPIRLWRQENGWGWPMPRIRLGRQGEDLSIRLKPRDRLWTRDFPTFLELDRGHRTQYRLEAGDMAPRGLEAAERFREEVLEIRGKLQCDPSPEAERYGVWVGTAEGETQIVSPPHTWLPVEREGGNET